MLFVYVAPMSTSKPDDHFHNTGTNLMSLEGTTSAICFNLQTKHNGCKLAW